MAGFWKKSLIYLGLVEEDEFEDVRETEETAPRYQAEPAPRKPTREVREHHRPTQTMGNVQPLSQQVKVHMVEPKSFNDAEQFGRKYKSNIPIILNLQMTDSDVRRRLVDFACGLTYAMDGGIQRVAENVYLLSPHNVEVSAEDKKWMLDKGFFNQM